MGVSGELIGEKAKEGLEKEDRCAFLGEEEWRKVEGLRTDEENKGKE